MGVYDYSFCAAFHYRDDVHIVSTDNPHEVPN